MKIQVLVITLFILLLSPFAFAQNLNGVQLNDGILIYGDVYESSQNSKWINIKKKDGSIETIRRDDVLKFLNNENGNFKLSKTGSLNDNAGTNAYSAEGPYISGSIGAAIPVDSDLTDSTVPGVVVELESETGIALGIALGYAFNENIRIEGELAYQKNDIDKVSALGISVNADGDSSSLALLLNGYFDFANSSAFTPFISAGIGVAQVDVNDFSIAGITIGSEDDTVFAYQVGLGVGYAINKKTNIDLKYRYFGTADPDFDGIEAEYGSHNVYVGLRFGF